MMKIIKTADGFMVQKPDGDYVNDTMGNNLFDTHKEASLLLTSVYAKHFALDEWLSDYPEDKTYEEIIEMMVGGADEDDSEWVHDQISVWQTVEHFTLRQVADFIDDTKAHFINTVTIMKLSGEFK